MRRFDKRRVNRKRKRDQKLWIRRIDSKVRRKARRLRNDVIPKDERRIHYTNPHYEICRAPEQLSFVHHPDETIGFLNSLEHLFSKKKKTFVDLSQTYFIDIGVIAALLSVMNLFKAKGIGFNGNSPKYFAARKLLYDSGFFKELFNPSENEFEFGEKNQLHTQGSKKVIAELSEPLTIQTGYTIFNEKRIFKGLHRVLMELQMNTNNHAVIGVKGAKPWCLSVRHDFEMKKVHFSFVDYGVGIFESLYNKPESNKWFNIMNRVSERIIHGKQYEVLKLLLDGELHLSLIHI